MSCEGAGAVEAAVGGRVAVEVRVAVDGLVEAGVEDLGGAIAAAEAPFGSVGDEGAMAGG